MIDHESECKRLEEALEEQGKLLRKYSEENEKLLEAVKLCREALLEYKYAKFSDDKGCTEVMLLTTKTLVALEQTAWVEKNGQE